MMNDYFARMFRYNGWANAQAMRSLADCPPAQAEGTPILAHILAAEHIWLSRLQGRDPAMAVWPELALPACRTLAASLDAQWPDYLGALADGDLERIADYRTSRGDACRNTVADVLLHVIAHGPHHRGQLARLIRQAAGTPAPTDYILYLRTPISA